MDFICTPAQHFSGRSASRNKTLWCSWAVKGENCNFYFAGDSGYFPGFIEIGKRYGPFDMAVFPIGPYLPRWFMSQVHLDPHQAVRAFQDVKGKVFIPIHWGTFDLADEPLDAPPKELVKESGEQKLNLQNIVILKHGETRVVR